MLDVRSHDDGEEILRSRASGGGLKFCVALPQEINCSFGGK
jgi:hypothetical protein